MFYPKSKEEQAYLSRRNDISISYIPFGYKLSNSNVEGVTSSVRSIETLRNQNNNHITYKKDKIPASKNWQGCEADSCTIVFPTMYALWPVEESFPNIDHDVVEERLYSSPEKPRSHETQYGFPLKLQTYDNLLGQFVPLKNIKVQIMYDNVTSFYNTNSNGIVEIDPYLYSLPSFQISDIGEVQVSVIMESDKWIISSGGNSNAFPIYKYLGRISDMWIIQGNPSMHTETLASLTTEYECHRAIDYYYNDIHYLSSDIPEDLMSITLVASDSNMGEIQGATAASGRFITIYNSGLSKQQTISTVLHELGHIRHYLNNQNTYNYADTIVVESYASFVGWLLGEHYYLSKGYTKPYHGYQINYNSRQDWNINLSFPYYYYSPLFVDLWDNYNQSADHSLGVAETIAWVNLDVIEGMISCYTLGDCFNYLENYIGTYYSQHDYDNLRVYYFTE